VVLGPAAASTGFPLPFGPDPPAFIGLMFAVGPFAVWIGTLCWSKASQRLPAHLAGQLIVFETLAALTFALALPGGLPATPTLTRVGLLLGGGLVGAVGRT
jgi:drug/metabolite transporter (DMT)-like permease